MEYHKNDIVIKCANQQKTGLTFYNYDDMIVAQLFNIIVHMHNLKTSESRKRVRRRYNEQCFGKDHAAV